jgi:hypothetical protein
MPQLRGNEPILGLNSKKESSVSLSTTEVEYIAATTCCTQVIWMK